MRTTEVKLEDRIARETRHARAILEQNESNWGWSTPAGLIRRARRVEFLTAGARPPRGWKVLEVGCGTGTFTGDLARAYQQLTAVDVAEVLLAEAARRHPGVRFERQDIHATSFPDSTFDLVLGCSVLHHLDWNLALKEIGRILKPRGQIRFSEPNLINPQIFLQKNWMWLKRRMGDSPDESAFTPAQIRASLLGAGFVDVSAAPFEFLHPATPAPLIAPVVRLERLVERTPLVYMAGSIKITASRRGTP
jgi:SAM-dependent methyltransferase